MASRKEVFFSVFEDVLVNDVRIEPGEYRGYLTDRRSDTGGEVPAYVLAIPAIGALGGADVAAQSAGSRSGREIDVTATISEGKIRVTEDRGE
jgi:hypothetical protein